MLYYYLNRKDWPSSLNAMYRICGISKQGFVQYFNRRNRYAEEQAYLIELIRDIRADHPTMCCRSMYYKINPVFIGRDRFEALCRAHGFMTKRKRAAHKTTDSSGVKRFDNLVEDIELNRINQVWSSDITYYEVNSNFYYITFILDCYSRKILGHTVSSRLLTEQTTIPALKKAIKCRKKQIPPGLIFHSDGGGQYYDKSFLDLTSFYEMRNSMCKMAYQNGKAERVNGTIKNNYLKHRKIKSLSDLTRSVDRAVRLYNKEKPHISLGRMTPKQFEDCLANLVPQNKSTMKESVDTTHQINGASNPHLSEQNKSQNHDVANTTLIH